jgi:molybdate/tungstate transport system substrate-binding protein
MTVGESSIGRRSVLSALGAALGGLGGCTTVLSATGGQSATVSMLAAGSLNHALENGLRPRVDATLQVEAYGSARVARLVAGGQKDPDIVSLADVALFESSLRTDWHAEFATNALVVAYNAETAAGRRVARAGTDGWYRPLLEGIALGRTDPDLDPLGYRTLFALDLATDYYGTGTDLREAIPERDQLYPETQLASQFETGSIDAAIVYRNMAEQRGYDYVALPPEINLGDPACADQYAKASYELPDGTVVEGAPIRYGSTIRRPSPAVREVFATHVTGQSLTDFGFTVPEAYPRYRGNVPDRVTN